MRWLLAVVVLLLLSGCLGGPADPVEPAAPGPDESSPDDEEAAADAAPEADEGPPVRTYDAVHERNVGGSSSAVMSGNFGNNCMRFDGGLHRVLGGNVTVTWDADTPLTAELELVVFGDEPPYDRIAGASPLQVAFGAVPTEDDGLGIGVQVHGEIAAGYGQTVDVHVVFDYEGAADLEPQLNFGCTV